jgi:hypothetical protein
VVDIMINVVIIILNMELVSDWVYFVNYCVFYLFW